MPTESVPIVYCPYSSCMKELSSIPKRSKKCHHCKNEIVLRTHYFTKDKTFLTKEEAVTFDADRPNLKYLKRYVESIQQFLNVDYISLLFIYREHATVFRKRYAQEPSLEDVISSISNYLVAVYPNLAATSHFNHAIFLFETGSPSYLRIRNEGFTAELQEYHRAGHHNVQINNYDEHSCEVCRLMNEKVLTIQQALDTQLLPCKKCTFAFSEDDPAGWCRCTYTIPD